MWYGVPYMKIGCLMVASAAAQPANFHSNGFCGALQEAWPIEFPGRIKKMQLQNLRRLRRRNSRNKTHRENGQVIRHTVEKMGSKKTRHASYNMGGGVHWYFTGAF